MESCFLGKMLTDSSTDSTDEEDGNPFVRAFVAVHINDTVRENVARVQSELKKTGAHVSWMSIQAMHVSLAFLGNITKPMVKDASAALDEAAAGVKSFTFDVADIGTFGSPRSPRIIWAGIKNAEPMIELQRRTAELITAVGIELETRPFKPHLTLGRARSSRGRKDLVAALEQVGPVEFGHVEVQEIALMRSVLLPQGAQHTLLHAAKLGGPT